MKVILLGNAGAGKSTLARQLLNHAPATRLSLDEVAFKSGTERRPIAESVADVERFIAGHESWIIEGCYADIVEPILKYCETLIFLNPGTEACVAHCYARPWEPEKFSSKEAQDQNLSNLVAWVREYDSRDDEYGLRRHREIYERFEGEKFELNNSAEYVAFESSFGNN